jgi:hypothetical protein
MSHFKFTTNIHRARFVMPRTHKAKQNSVAFDDVHRIAMRTPSLYKINAVPTITSHMSGMPTMGQSYE